MFNTFLSDILSLDESEKLDQAEILLKTSVEVVEYVFDFGLVGDQLPRHVPEQSKQNLQSKTENTSDP